MNTFFKRVVLAAFFSLSLVFFSPNTVSAQETLGLQIKPAVVEDKVNPGEVHQYTLTVTNIATVERTFYVSVEDIKGIDEQGGPVFSQNNEVTGFELSTWASLPQKTITLGPGEGKSYTFSVHVPTNASPGSHFASVFFSDKPIKPELSGTGVGMSVGSIVSLRISGDINEEARLREFSTGKLIYGTADVDFNSKVSNLGNVLVQPRGVVEITNMFGKQVGSVPVNDALASVFPRLDRTYTVRWQSDGFAFGRYQAMVTLAYGDEARKSLYSTTSFWILPLVPIGSFLGGLLLIVLTVYVLMRRYIRKKLKEMGVPNASRADTDMYRRRYQKSSSRLMVITMAVILICIGFLAALFLLFA